MLSDDTEADTESLREDLDDYANRAIARMIETRYVPS